MKLKFLGAAGSVTGSSMQLTSSTGDSILIDCGLFQGLRETEQLNHEPLDLDVMSLSGVVLTHAHLDHCGRLPLLIKSGYKNTIYMTPPTSDITNISLYDTAKITRNNPEGELYSASDVDRTISLFRTFEYNQEFTIGPFHITFKNAGHIIGSASVEILDESGKLEAQKIVFSGDLGNSPEALIQPTELINSADFVVIESTYGDRFHSKEPPEEKLLKEINTIEQTGGVLLIPAFSIERSQEVLHIISHLKSSGKVKSETEVVFDGPMGDKVTDVFRRYQSYYSKELASDATKSDPFNFPGLNDIKKYEDSLEEVATNGPKVVVAGSGMMTGGRIVEYAARFLPIPTTRLLFVGYQSVGTLGRKILQGEKLVYIKGTQVPVKATITESHALSSHADQTGLIKWLAHIKGVKKVFIEHGEDPVRQIFADKITQKIGIKDITIPNFNEEYTF